MEPHMNVPSVLDFLLLPAFEQAAVGMTLLTPEGNFVAANPALCRFTGRTSAELQTLNLLAVILPADRATAQTTSAAWLAHTRPP